MVVGATPKVPLAGDDQVGDGHPTTSDFLATLLYLALFVNMLFLLAVLVFWQ